MISDIIEYANTEFKFISDEANKIHPCIFRPIYRVANLDESMATEDLTSEYKKKIEPLVNDLKSNIQKKIKDYLDLMVNELTVMGLKVGIDLSTSNEIDTVAAFSQIYKTGNFFAVAPFSHILDAVVEQFNFFINLKPFWQFDIKIKYNNSSFHVYPAENNIAYVKQITNALNINRKESETTISKLTSIIKRKNNIPYDIIMDVPMTNTYPFYTSTHTFEKVMLDIETELTLHEVLYCIKTDEELYNRASAYNVDISDYLK